MLPRFGHSGTLKLGNQSTTTVGFPFHNFPPRRVTYPTESGKTQTKPRTSTTTAKQLLSCKFLHQLNTSSNSNSHKRSQRFICSMNGCTRSYKRRYELLRHQKRHSGIRGYACGVIGCDRSG